MTLSEEPRSGVGDAGGIESSGLSLTTVPVAAQRELNRQAPNLATVVGWLAAHCAALEHVVAPKLRALADAEFFGTSGACEERLRELERALRELHQHVNGDALVRPVSLPRVWHQLLEVLDGHVRDLERLSQRVALAIGEPQLEVLVELYLNAVRVAPRRPHPHTPHRGPLEPWAFAVNARLDRVLDVVDARAVAPMPLPSSPAELEAARGRHDGRPAIDSPAERPARIS